VEKRVHLYTLFDQSTPKDMWPTIFRYRLTAKFDDVNLDGSIIEIDGVQFNLVDFSEAQNGIVKVGIAPVSVKDNVSHGMRSKVRVGRGLSL